MEEKALFERAMKGTKKYLENKGAEILSEWKDTTGDVLGWVFKEIDLDDPTSYCTCFCKVNVRDAGGCLPNYAVEINRERFESAAALWLSENDTAEEFCIRFDVISMIVVKPGQAMLRRHIDVLGNADSEVRENKAAELPEKIVLKVWEREGEATTAVIFRPGNVYRPFVAAYGYDSKSGKWSHSCCFENANDAWNAADPEIIESLSEPVTLEDLSFAFKDAGENLSLNEVGLLADKCSRVLDVTRALDEDGCPW